MIKIYGIKNCDSVKKAIKFFKTNNLEYELFDFKSQELSCQKIQEWLKKTDIETLFNARSTTYRTLKLKELNLDASDKENYLCKENLLIKRPVIEYNNSLLVGFNEENYTRSFL